jgi:hypothetical protein
MTKTMERPRLRPQLTEVQIVDRIVDHLEQAAGEIYCACEFTWPTTLTYRKRLLKSTKHVLKRTKELTRKIEGWA